MLNKITAIIPARLASSRLPNKVLADIHGKAMIVRVAERVRMAGINNIFVATDSQEVVNVCRDNKINSILTEDVQTGTDRVVCAVKLLGLSDNSLVINIQGDEPLIDTQVIINVANTIISASLRGIYCATPIGKISDVADVFNPNVVKCVINNFGEALYFSRAPIAWFRGVFPQINSQFVLPKTLPKNYLAYRHYGVYAFQVGFLKQFPILPKSQNESWESLEQLRILDNGFKIQTIIVDSTPLPAVDTLEDLEKVRNLWKSNNL